MEHLSCPARECAQLPTSQVFERLDTRNDGLSDVETLTRQRLFGANRLPSPPRATLLRRILDQLTSPLILILIAVAVLAPLIGHPSDAVIIVFVLIFNATISIIQEGRASQALRALEDLSTPTCLVRRNGKTLSIPVHEVTVGDIIILKEGDRIPADGRFIEAQGTVVDESTLTGESIPVRKTAAPMTTTATMALGDIHNAGFSQTLVVSGSALFVISSIGKETEIGKIATALKQQQTEPPLALQVKRLSKQIAIVVMSFSAILFCLGFLLGEQPITLLATVLSLAVSIIPEGLPIVLTIVLAHGVNIMARKHAVVKKLNAVEGLGQVQVICTDKTGTLTTNTLVVQTVIADNTQANVTGTGFDPNGSVSIESEKIHFGNKKSIDTLAQAASLFGRSSLRHDAQGWHPIGDPIDAALLCFAKRYQTPDTETWKLIEEQPFSYTEKRRSGRWQLKDAVQSFMIGSPESVLSQCEIRDTEKYLATTHISALAQRGLRVIALAERNGDTPLQQKQAWTFVGFYGMGDTLRTEVVESVAWCKEQNIRVVMITGDHPETALAIAKQAGIANDISQVLNGTELETLNDADLTLRIDTIRVFSRVAPEHKLRLINAYRAKGLITAMTGDGVNDAPALHQADIGVAMGKSGTDVAREAADLILMDDHFATIVAAIQEGRLIFANIQRVIFYLFSTSLAEAGIITLTVLLRLPLPLLPAQIIWINLITDSFLDISLGLEPQHRTTHAVSKKLINTSMVARMSILGLTMITGTLIIYLHILDHDSAYLQTMVLTTLAVYQWFNAWNARNDITSIVRLPIFSNRPLLWATGFVISLQLLAVYTPFMQSILHTTPLSLRDWSLIIAVASTVVLTDEIWKQRSRTRHAKTSLKK